LPWWQFALNQLARDRDELSQLKTTPDSADWTELKLVRHVMFGNKIKTCRLRYLLKGGSAKMRFFRHFMTALLAFSLPAFASVRVDSPTKEATVASPVHFMASATAPNCSKGVRSMRIYANNQLIYAVRGHELDATVALATGAERTIVEEWDECGGRTHATVEFTVASEKVKVSITASPSSIVAGNCSNLKVSASNAKLVDVTGSDGTSFTLGDKGGTLNVRPATTTTFTAKARGVSGDVSATKIVTVSQAQTVSINANPTSIVLGTASNLTVTATDSTSVVINGSDGSSYTFPPTGGTTLVNPVANTTYTVTSTGAEGNVTATVNVVVESTPNVLSNLQTATPWRSWGQLPPKYRDCSPCKGIDWSMEQGITGTSLSGNATEFDTWGTVGYAGVLWINSIIGQYSTQGLPDPEKALVPSLNNFTYDTDIYVTDASITQALEFDVAMYYGGTALFWGTQCVEPGVGNWDYLNDATKHWVSTGVPCGLENGWNHLTLQFRRLPGNELQYSSITMNGITAYVNETSAPRGVPASWYGIDVNYQMDGDKTQASNTTYLDNLTLTYW
jgi:hypothetical protein